MNDSTNPYRPPIDVTKTRIVADLNWHELPSGRLDFSFQLTPADVGRYVTPRRGMWFPIGLAMVTVLLVIIIILRYRTGAGLVLLPSIVFLLGLLWALFILVLLLQRLISKQTLSQSPALLESTTGYLNAEGIFVATHHEKGFSKWESTRRITLNDHCALISSDTWRQIGTIIPWSAFEDPSAALAAMESVSKQITVDTSLALDERLRLKPEDEPMFAPPDPHVSFSGEIKIEQITDATAGKKLRRSVRRVLIIGAITILIALTTLLEGPLLFVFVGLPLCIFAGWLMIRVYKHPLYSGDPDTVAFHLVGWFGEQAYFVHTFTSQTVREYVDLQACTLDDTMISLRVPGSVDAWQFIPRTMFSSDDEFQQVCRWVASVVTVAQGSKDNPRTAEPGDESGVRMPSR